VVLLEPPDDRSAQFGDRVVQLRGLGCGGGAGPLIVALVAFAPDRIQQVYGRRGNTHRLPQRKNRPLVRLLTTGPITGGGEGQDRKLEGAL
jgi:hypothetical protein